MECRKCRKALDIPGHAHALTFSTYRGHKVLAESGVAEIVLAELAKARDSQDFDLWAYVVMPEHMHVVLHPRNETYQVSSILRAIKGPTALRIFESFPWLRDRCSTPRGEHRIWQAGGGFDRNLVTSKAAWNEISYVHANPVRRGLCEAATDWPFSSAGAYTDPPRPTLIEVDLCRWGVD